MFGFHVRFWECRKKTSAFCWGAAIWTLTNYVNGQRVCQDFKTCKPSCNGRSNHANDPASRISTLRKATTWPDIIGVEDFIQAESHQIIWITSAIVQRFSKHMHHYTPTFNVNQEECLSHVLLRLSFAILRSCLQKGSLKNTGFPLVLCISRLVEYEFSWLDTVHVPFTFELRLLIVPKSAWADMYELDRL